MPPSEGPYRNSSARTLGPSGLRNPRAVEGQGRESIAPGPSGQDSFAASESGKAPAVPGMGGFEVHPQLGPSCAQGMEGEGYEVESMCMEVDGAPPSHARGFGAAAERSYGCSNGAGRRPKPSISLGSLQCNFSLDESPVGPTGREARECPRSACSAGPRPSFRHRHCASLSGTSPLAPNELHPINFFLTRSGSDDAAGDSEKATPSNPILRELQRLEEHDERRRAGLGLSAGPTVRHSNPILREVERLERSDKRSLVQTPQGFQGGAHFSTKYFMQPPSAMTGTRHMGGTNRVALSATRQDTQAHDASVCTAMPSRMWGGAQDMTSSRNSNAILRELQQIERSEGRPGNPPAPVQSGARVVLPKRKPDSPSSQALADMEVDGFDTASSRAGVRSGQGGDMYQWTQPQMHYSQPIRPIRSGFSG